MMLRANQELANGNTTIAILLSAMAVEGEMAYLFLKWKGIDSGKLPASQTQDDRDKWEGEWADMRSIGKRFDELSNFLTGAKFDKFVMKNKGLLGTTLSGYDPAESFKKYFQEQFFERRNRIVHYGEIDAPKTDGELCFLLASTLLGIVKAMDAQRIKHMDEIHKHASESTQ